MQQSQKATAPGATAPTDSRAIKLAHAALLGALLLLLAGLLWKDVSSAQMSASLFAYPFQFDESEGMIVAETMLLDQGRNIYLKPTPDLFVAAPYPPVYYLLAWPAQHIVGHEPTFKIGRALSILSALVAGVCLFGLTTALTRDRLAGALAAALWWSLGLVAFWGSLVKPDVLALALGLGGLWWVVSRPASRVWWALPFFLGAFYTKQTAIAAGVAAVAWLLITRPRAGITFGASYAAGALLPGLLFSLLTDGGYFYHMYTIHSLPWFPDRFRDFALGFISAYGVFVIPGILTIFVSAGLWIYARVTVGAIHTSPLLAMFYFCMACVEATGAGTLGGNHNHFLELAAASCLGLGIGTALLRRAQAWQAQIVAAIVALLMVAQVPSLFATPNWLGLELRVPPPLVTEGMNNIFQYVTNNGGQAYSDNVGLLLLAHKKLWSTDPFTQTHATRYGRWDESRLVDAIRRKQFSQIILRIDITAPDTGAGDVSPRILQAVRDNYKLDQRNVENIYVPR